MLTAHHMTGRAGRAVGVNHDEDLVGNVVRELRLIDRSAGWARTSAVGEAVINSFFAGDCQAFRSSPRRAHQSLRRIASHAGCPLKKSALASAVHVYVFVVEHPEVLSWECVLPGHVAAVLRRQPSEQLALLQRVQAERPSVKSFALQVRMRDIMPMRAPALPRPHAAAAALGALRSVERDLQSVAELLTHPNSWLDPRLEGARSVVARLGAPLAKATATVAAMQLVAPSKSRALDT